MLKNITLSAEEVLIDEARKKAQKQKKTLNVLFREWLRLYIHHEATIHDFDKIMKKLQHVHPGGPYSRETMNER